MWGYDYFDDPLDRKEQKDYGPMGPKHPFWKEAKREVESLLRQAGRVYDKKTVEAIAMDHDAWGQLIDEASENMRIVDQANRMNMLMDMVKEVRSEVESRNRRKNLFGGETHIVGEED